ncbi:predicted protein [Botrytis cinerea T4]|uniref:Uncharacterized protein n=1 Tax=Botryotinia fuckeliana (strain T4) TaxID=999810 RepID=G2YII2_BOTF4|nr:predicted protein [Botrytis cinerea T4]
MPSPQHHKPWKALPKDQCRHSTHTSCTQFCKVSLMQHTSSFETPQVTFG